MPSFRRIALLAAAAPLALALAACGDSAEDGAPTGEPLATIAAPAGQTWVETAAETPEGGFVIGNPDAPLKLVEYASHTCSHCAAFSQEGAAELDEYVAKGIVSYELRNQIHDPIDMTIALLARCGSAQSFHPLANQAWQNFNSIMQTVQANGAALQQAQEAPQAQRFQAIAQASGLLEFFAARGISRDQAMTCLADIGKAQRIADASQTQSEELDVAGTPTFFLNGRLVEGTSWGPTTGPNANPGIEAALQAAGAR
jgi:protein-disulfide isomerase